MSRIFWDTNLFIYLIEDHPEFARPAIELRSKMVARGDELITSTMTLAEVQVAPLRAGDVVLASRHKETIRNLSVVVPFDEAAADHFARIRTMPSVQPADAIQLSCAAAAGVEIFITNDIRLTRLHIDGIHFITSMDRVPF